MARILMLTPQLPYPPHQGTSLRNLHILKALSERHSITLLSFAERDRPQEIEPLSSLCHVLEPIQAPRRSIVDRLLQLATSPLPDVAMRLRSDDYSFALVKALRSEHFDAVQVEGIELAGYIDSIRKVSPLTKVVLDCHNAETQLQRRARRADLPDPARWPAAVYSGIQVGRLARFERWALREADAVTAVSATDRTYLLQVLGDSEKEITIIPNTIDVVEYLGSTLVDGELSYDLVFTGKMDYRPNIDGVLWFAEQVWPVLKGQRPETTWAIVGQRPNKRIDMLKKQDGITVTGRVHHVQPFISAASVYIIPLRIGSGTRLKLIEAMAAGKAIISTTLGAEGVDIADGAHIILADTADEWVVAINQLLDDEFLRSKLGTAAREFAAMYDWRRTIPEVNAVYQSIIPEE